MTEGIPEYPLEILPAPLLEHDRQLTARPSERQMESSRVRRRRMQNELQEFLKVSWNFTEDEFGAFKSFHEDDLDNGSLSFLLRTFEEDPAGSGETLEVDWELAFVGDPHHARSDNLFSVSATLEVLDKQMVEPLPDIVFGYFHDEGDVEDNPTIENNPSDCRENVSILLDNLVLNQIYLLVIGNDAAGPWYPYIYFALLTEEERSTLHKRISMPNWFEGRTVFFRVKLYKNATGAVLDAFMTKSGSPLPPQLAPPTVDLANLSDITYEAQLLGANVDTSAEGFRSLEYYSVGGVESDGPHFIPYSFIEDPMTFTSRMYRHFHKKYALRQHSWGYWGTLLAIGSQNQAVTMVAPAGATATFTRDGSVPEETTEMKTYSGVVHNAFAIDDTFKGVIMARCFKAGCRSPLVLVAVDKLMYERPTLVNYGPANGISGYCDLPVIDIVTGLPSESGNSCNILWGGICPYEVHNYSLGTSGGSTANARNDPSGHGPMLRKRVKSIQESVFIGWPIHSVGSSYFEFFESIWNGSPSSGYFNHWQDAARNHNWAVLVRNSIAGPGLTFMGVILMDEIDALNGLAMSLAGPLGTQGEADRTAWKTTRDGRIMDLLPDPPVPDCNVNLNQFLYAERFDIMRSPLYYYEMRDLYWLGAGFDFPVVIDIPFDPLAPPPPLNPYDDFQTYAEGDATTQTMDYRTGTDWNAAWIVRDGTQQTTGWDLFESYATGAVPDHVASPAPEYIPYDDGEAWEPAVEWVFRYGDLSTSYVDDFESYVNGAAPFDMAGGTGWAPGEYWVIASDLIGGDERWETYANGAITPSNTGSNFLLSENWRIT